MSRKIRKTVLQVIVVHEDEFPAEWHDLGVLAHQMDEGECVGESRLAHTMPLPENMVQGVLLAVGNDGTFFDDEDAPELPAAPSDVMLSHWDEDADYPVADWRAEVEADDTRLGYLDWVIHQRLNAADAD